MENPKYLNFVLCESYSKINKRKRVKKIAFIMLLFLLVTIISYYLLSIN